MPPWAAVTSASVRPWCRYTSGSRSWPIWAWRSAASYSASRRPQTSSSDPGKATSCPLRRGCGGARLGRGPPARRSRLPWTWGRPSPEPDRNSFPNALAAETLLAPGGERGRQCRSSNPGEVLLETVGHVRPEAFQDVLDRALIGGGLPQADAESSQQLAVIDGQERVSTGRPFS